MGAGAGARQSRQARRGREESRQFEAALAEYRTKTSRPEPPELKVARQELAGHLALAQKRIGKGLKKLQAASRAERRLTYTEPPYYPRPAAEALGQAALRNGRPDAAAKAFRVALEQYPADAHAKRGLQAALETPSGKGTRTTAFR